MSPAPLRISGDTVVVAKKLKGELSIPSDATSAKQRLDALLADELSSLCLERSWHVAVDIVRMAMRLLQDKENWPEALALPEEPLHADLDDPEIVRHLLGAEIPAVEQRV